jgi:hypothetical protein
VLTIWVCNFLQNDFGAKAAHKMLVQLTPGSRNHQLSLPQLFKRLPDVLNSIYLF